MVTAFLGVMGALFLLVYGIPLLIAPRRWARVFRWPEVDGATALTDYLGRCLGAVACALMTWMLVHCDEPAAQPLLLELGALAGALLLGVHVRGAIARDQPWTEDAEIVLYGVATAAALALRLSL